jgi:hypothetical protein
MLKLQHKTRLSKIQKRFEQIALGLLVATPLFILVGCLLEPTQATSIHDQGQSTTDQPTALRDKTPIGRPGDPVGCFREWDGIAQDSVLNCPDIRPPNIK